MSSSNSQDPDTKVLLDTTAIKNKLIYSVQLACFWLILSSYIFPWLSANIKNILPTKIR
ncbi:hypothetical protein SHAM105786_09020 [Shewanella amazonensis]